MPTSFVSNRRNDARVFANSAGQQSVNTLIYGDPGSGKSTFLSTCVAPIYIFSFDPGGTKLPALTALEAKGLAVLDTVYETEDDKKPFAFAEFNKVFSEISAANEWSKIGTVAIDYLTTFERAVMNAVLKEAGRAGTQPQLQDYGKVQVIFSQVLRALCALPCDFVLTAHVSTDRDELTGALHSSLLCAGKLAYKIPVLFDEVLLTTVSKGTGGALTHGLQTRSDGKLKASSRRFGTKEFAVVESPNMKHLRKKAGLPTEDLQPLGD